MGTREMGSDPNFTFCVKLGSDPISPISPISLHSRMRLSVYPSEKAAAAALARQIADRLRAKPDLVLGLPTGRTPIPLYKELVALHRNGGVDFSQAATFNLDEFIGVQPGEPGSYRHFMQQHLFAH